MLHVSVELTNVAVVGFQAQYGLAMAWEAESRRRFCDNLDVLVSIALGNGRRTN